MIPDYEISKYPEHKIKSKIGTIFVNEKKLQEKLRNWSLFLLALQRTNKSYLIITTCFKRLIFILSIIT